MKAIALEELADEDQKTQLARKYSNNWYVYCCNCRASGPVKKDVREAKEAWNTRK